MRILRYLVREGLREAERMFRRSVRKLLPMDLLELILDRVSTPFYICFSRGMQRIPDLSRVVGERILFLPAGGLTIPAIRRHASLCRGVLLWGAKERDTGAGTDTSCQAFLKHPGRLWKRHLRTTREFSLLVAERCALPVLRLEDGFLRSVDLGVHGARPLSLVLDRTGIYYDATGPSDLETCLNTADDLAEDHPLAEAAMAAVVRHSLSKYNHAPLLPETGSGDTSRKRVLILDQTRGDMSIQLGLADRESFRTMLHAAIRDNPDADVYLKVHPDVLCGKKQGNLDPDELPDRIQVIAEDVAPLSLLRHMDVVYTVTSQMGFEALLLGKPVHCFGMPFYAGWGVTTDHVACPRRTRKRSVLDIFTAAYIRYAVYLSPVLHERTSITTVLHLLEAGRNVNERNRGYHACLGFRRWKHSHARAFLRSTDGEVGFFDDEERAIASAGEKHGCIVVWASRMSERLPEKACAAGVPLLRMEDGFLRSVGLGSDFFRPGSLVLDDLGIYYDPERPSRLERILSGEIDQELLSAAETLRQTLVERGISKYNMQGTLDLPELPRDRRILLVPGQVEDDASVRRGGGSIQSNLALLRAVRGENPDAYILYKEHPDVVHGNREGGVRDEDAAGLADMIIRTSPIEQVFPLVHEVHTLTSLTGFEALLRGIPVHTYGGPFYAGWGFTTDRRTFQRRKRLPSLAYLIAGALLLYPTYYDWSSEMPVDCLSFLDVLQKDRPHA